MQERNMLVELFKNSRSIGIVGGINSGKSSFTLQALIDLKEKHNVAVYTLGTEKNLLPYLASKGIFALHSTQDVLDLKIKNAVIYIDEFADLFDTKIQSKQGRKIKNFFNRIAHLNNYVVISSAVIKFWNTVMCSLVRSYIVKSVEYSHLVRGTDLKRDVMAIAGNTSEYRLDIGKDEYYVLCPELPARKGSFVYNKELDSKKGNFNPFVDLELNLDLNPEMVVEVRGE